jgi:hypothetical protein
MLIRYGDSPQLSPLGLLCNTGEAGLLSNISAACQLGLPEVIELPANDVPVVICGGGPSLADTLESVRELQKKGAKVYALNNAARFLVLNGIRPDAQVMVDPRPQNADFINEAWADELLLSSQCAPEVFAQAKEIGYPVRIWHPAQDGTEQVSTRFYVGGGLTVGLCSICLAFMVGHREIHLFGYDSSHAKGLGHAYEQQLNNNVELVTCVVDSQEFTCSLAMAGQSSEFTNVQKMLEDLGAKITVYGDGLLPTLWRANQREKNQKILTAAYDLGVSPPSYDFLSFLIEAERHRLEIGFDQIDIAFQPGPWFGFRHDDLPPDVPTRQGMLWRVCVGMAKLLPSVRNVMVLGQRMDMPEAVFPVGYKQDAPISHYGTCYLRGGEPMLRASDSARKQVALRFSKPYATITLREAEYWSDRNSNRAEWIKVADWLLEQNIQPVFIPDTYGNPVEGYQSFDAAAFDIDLRAAMYEGAVVNLGVMTGPMSLPAFLEARYLICKVVCESAVASTRAFLKAHGFEDGDDFGGNGRMIWKDDKAETIIEALKEVLQPTEKTS